MPLPGRSNEHSEPQWGATWVRLGALVLVPVGLVFGLLIWILFGTVLPLSLPAQEAATRLEIVKIALSAGGGVGALIALTLAARRQWSVESNNAKTLAIREIENQQRDELAKQDIAQREIEARQAGTDATQRRIADLFTAAANQLGNDRPAVRQAAFFSLEQLGNAHPTTQQMVANVICMYLRSPFQPPMEDDFSRDARAAREEGLVRKAALEVLGRNLNDSKYDDSKWAGIWLNLEGAYIERLMIMFGALGLLNLSNATVEGPALLGACEWESNVILSGATIKNISLGESVFNAGLILDDVVLGDGVKEDFLRDCWVKKSQVRGLPEHWSVSEERNPQGLQRIINVLR